MLENVMERHGHRLLVNRPYLNGVLPQDLPTPECEILYWAARALTLGEISAKTGLPLDDLFTAARRFENRGIAVASPASEDAARRHYADATGLTLAPRAEQTLGALFRQAAARYADRKLFVYAGDGSDFSYEDARQGVERVARALAAAGLKKGDVIAADAEPTPEFALLFWAAMDRGLVLASLNPAWPDATVTDVLKAAGAKLVFLPSRRAAVREGAIVFDSSVDENAKPNGRTFSEWMEIADADASEPAPVAVADTDVAAIIFTSGTTGLPKGVTLSHGALYRSAQNLVHEFHWRPDDVLLIPGEFHSIGGLRGPLVCVLHAGASFVLTTQAQRRHPLTILPVATQTGTTILNVTPAFLVELGKARDRMAGAALPTVRLVLSTAAPLTSAAAAALKPFANVKLGNYYGLTESTGASLYVHDIDTTGTAPREPGFVGRPVGVLVRIVDEDGKRLPPGAAGEVCFYGENLMSGYLNNPEETARVLRGGWLHTGDIGVMSADGTLTLKGRKREIIKDDFGDIVSPLEIEACLGVDPGVEEVAVCGFSDPATAREALAAFVVPKPGSASAEELVDALRQRVIEKLGVRKVPRHFQIVAAFPRNSLGKVVKRDLVEDYLNARKKS